MEDRELDRPATVLNGQKLVEGRPIKSGVVLADKDCTTVIWIDEIIKDRTTLTIKWSEKG